MLFCIVTLVSSFSVEILQPKTPVTIKPLPLVAAATAALLSSPLMAFAEEMEDYEYGAVDAPIAVPLIGGVLAIGTALLPVAMKGGEEAFEEMKDRDSDTFGKRNDILSKRK